METKSEEVKGKTDKRRDGRSVNIVKDRRKGGMLLEKKQTNITEGSKTMENEDQREK